MLTLNVKKPFVLLAGMLLAILACAPAFGAPVEGVEVEVRNHEGRFVGGNLIDGDTSTAWVGGGSGSGPGKWIEFFFPAEVRLDSLKVATGHQGKGKFDKYRRLIRGVILYPDETRQKFTLKSVKGVQTIRLETKVVRTFRVIITGVDPAAGDKTVGKVAISEMTVHGEVTGAPVEDGETGAAQDKTTEAKEETKAAGKPTPVEKSAPASKPVKVEKKPEAKPAPEEPAKTSPAPPAKRPAPVAVEKKKSAPKPEKKPAPKPEKKSAPKPVEHEKKPAPKKVVKKPQAEPKKVASKPKKTAPKPKTAAPSKGATYLRPAVEVPVDKPLDMGAISPWLDLEVVAKIKRYFAQLTTLSDVYPEVFAVPVRERERTAFLKLQEDMRARKLFGMHSISMPELIGLSFDKPQESGDAMTVRVHGPYRYYMGDKAFEFVTDTRFSLIREDGAWLISDVHDK